MSVLLQQLWATLLIAFACGGLFGWLLKSWRAHALHVAIRDGSARCDSLQAEAGKQRDELKDARERLRASDAELQVQRNAAAAAAATAAADPQLAQLQSQLAESAAQLAASGERINTLEAQLVETGAALAARLGAGAVLKAELERTTATLRQEQAERAALDAAGEQSRERARSLEDDKAQLVRALAEARAAAPPAQPDPALQTALTLARDQHAAAERQSEALCLELDQLRQELQAAQAAAHSVTAAPVTAVAAPADDLQQIRGVGPKIARLLHELGVHSFRQIAQASTTELDRLAAALPGFASRIQREDWRGQCARLHQAKYGTAP